MAIAHTCELKTYTPWFTKQPLHPRWVPLLKIEISSNGQNCFILSQNVPKFELSKHNDELFSMVWFNLVQRFQRRRFKCDLLSKYA
jgi:hypothetical protein